MCLAASFMVSKKMLADFTKTVAANPKSGENPYAKKCGFIVRGISKPRKI